MVLPPRIGTYKPLFRIGSGGMGEVFAARSEGLLSREMVAIKRVVPCFMAPDEAARALRDEARAASRVNHPHVVSVHAVEEDDEGQPYVVMELITGGDLEQIVALHHPLPVDVAMEWIAQIALGLDAVHRATDDAGRPLSLVHRDVTPHNVLVGTDGQARISDFGIAWSPDRLQAATRTGAIKGKLRYMSPEQAQGLGVSAKSDVFSLGATAWEALVGRPLIEEQAPSRMLEEIRRGRFCAPGDRRAGVPAEVSRAILSALAPSPEDRITPLELATTLRASCAPTTQAERARLVLPVAKAKLNKLAATRAVTEALEVANLPPSGNAASRSRRALGTLRTWLPSALARFLRVG